MIQKVIIQRMLAISAGILLMASYAFGYSVPSDQSMCQEEEEKMPGTLKKIIPSKGSRAEGSRAEGSQAEGSQDSEVMGHVFVMTNSFTRWPGNQVVMYDRDKDGMLTLRNAYRTSGRGSGPAPTATTFAPDFPMVTAAHDGLGSQGSLIMNTSRNCLVGVNAASNTVFSFKIAKGKGLRRKSLIDSDGVFPNSLALGSKPDSRGLYPLFILNALDQGSIGHAWMDDNCILYEEHPDDSDELDSICLAQFTDTFPLPEPGEVLTSPAQIMLNPDESKLLVTVKGGPDSSFTGRVVVFDVDSEGKVQGDGYANEFTMGSENGVGRRGPFSMTFVNKDTLAINHVNDHSIGLYLLASKYVWPVGDPVPTNTKFPCWIKKSSRGVVLGSFGELKALDSSLLADGPGIFSTFNVDESCQIESFTESARFDETVNGNHIIDFDIVESHVESQNGHDSTSPREFLYAVQPRTGSIAMMEIKQGNSGPNSMVLESKSLTPVTGMGVDPNSESINAFEKRCFNYRFFRSKPLECAASSIQGIVGF